MTEITLEGCPHCGAPSELGVCDDAGSINFNGRFIQCTNIQCGASTNIQFGEDAESLLAERWNRRSYRKPMVEQPTLPGIPEPEGHTAEGWFAAFIVDDLKRLIRQIETKEIIPVSAQLSPEDAGKYETYSCGEVRITMGAARVFNLGYVEAKAYAKHHGMKR